MSEWIRCDVRMPDDREDKLIWVRSDGRNRPEVGFYYKTDNSWQRVSGAKIPSEYVTHWRELPAPPQTARQRSVNEIRPCPFCGGLRIAKSHGDNEHVECLDCGVDVYFCLPLASEDVWEAWNERTDDGWVYCKSRT